LIEELAGIDVEAVSQMVGSIYGSATPKKGAASPPPIPPIL
jgi:hypothetical protein